MIHLGLVTGLFREQDAVGVHFVIGFQNCKHIKA